jgi:hypothetical protein
MGSAVLSLLLSPFVFVSARILIQKYRELILARLQQTKLWKLVKATALYKFYAKYDELYG